MKRFVISQSNSLLFVKQCECSQQFDNRLPCEQVFYDGIISDYSQKFNPEDDLDFYFISSFDNNVARILKDDVYVADLVLTVTGTDSYSNNIYKATVPFLGIGTFYIEIVATDADAELQRFRTYNYEVSNDVFLKIGYSSPVNAFLQENSTGVINLENSQLKNYDPSAELENYTDNYNSSENINGTYKRVLQLTSSGIPSMIAEQLLVAFLHKEVKINGVEFVISEKPEITNLGNSNLVNLAANVIQKELPRLYDIPIDLQGGGGEDRYNIDFGVVPVGDFTYQIQNKALLYLYCAGRTAGTDIYINGVFISGDSECYRVTNYAQTTDIRIVTGVAVSLAIEVLDISNL